MRQQSSQNEKRKEGGASGCLKLDIFYTRVPLYYLKAKNSSQRKSGYRTYCGLCTSLAFVIVVGMLIGDMIDKMFKGKFHDQYSFNINQDLSVKRESDQQNLFYRVNELPFDGGAQPNQSIFPAKSDSKQLLKFAWTVIGGKNQKK